MKKLIYLAALMVLPIVCFEGCGKDKNPTPSSTVTTGTTVPTGTSTGY